MYIILTQICTCEIMSVYTPTYIDINIYIYIYIYIYKYTHTQTHTHKHIHTHKHTHIHTYLTIRNKGFPGPSPLFPPTPLPHRNLLLYTKICIFTQFWKYINLYSINIYQDLNFTQFSLYLYMYTYIYKYICILFPHTPLSHRNFLLYIEICIFTQFYICLCIYISLSPNSVFMCIYKYIYTYTYTYM
jgi:hypothetical protein